MSLLQVKVNADLKAAIKLKAKAYGIPASTLVRIVLVKTFLEGEPTPGNVFNADRDNGGKGINIDDLISGL